MKPPTLKTLGIVLRLLRVAGSNPSGSSAKSCIERTLRLKIDGPFSIENYQVLKSGHAMTLAGAQTQDIYEITARYGIALQFSGGRIDEGALVRMGCTKRNRIGGRFFYHCVTTIEFRKSYNRWKAIALRAPCAFYLGR